jgi:proline iminopeptidase
VSEGFLTRSDGARLWYTVSGDGPALLLANGGPGCADYLGPVAALVEDRVRVVRFEPRGCGRSDRKGPYDLPTTLADVEALRLHTGADRWTVGGHSAGADLALACALTSPATVRGVVCIAGGRVHDDRQWHRVYDLRRQANPEVPPPGSQPFSSQVNARGNRSFRDFCREPDLLRRIAALPMPVRYILAGDDIRPNWPLQQVAALARVGAAEAVHGAGHNLWTTHAEPLRAALRRAIDAIVAAGP